MSLFSNLTVGSQALLSFQKGIDVVNKNMTNIYTKGYKREIPTYTNFPINGVNFDQAKRVYDERLLNRFIDTNQKNSFNMTLSSNLGSIEQIFNDINGTGFASALDNFFYSMNDIITSPDNLAARDSFLYASETLIGRIRSSYDELSNIKITNQQSIQDNINQLNLKLKALAKVNRAIKTNLDNESILNSNLNERDRLLEEISSLIDTKVRFNSDKSVDLFSSKGHTLLLFDKPFEVSLKNEPNTITINDPDTGDTLTYNINSTQLLINGVNLTQEFQNGIIGAKLATEVALDEMIYNLNSFTFKFANILNATHTSGYDIDGNLGDDLFVNEDTLSPLDIDASNIKLNFLDPRKVAASNTNTGIESNNSNMINMFYLKDEKFTILQNQTLNEFYNSSLVAKIGTKKSYIDNFYSDSKALLESISSKIDELSGVNMDEELIRLTQLQRSYEASARIITVTDELLQTVMGLVD